MWTLNQGNGSGHAGYAFAFDEFNSGLQARTTIRARRLEVLGGTRRQGKRSRYRRDDFKSRVGDEQWLPGASDGSWLSFFIGWIGASQRPVKRQS